MAPPPLFDLPRGPALVLATVLAAVPAHAEPTEPTDTEQAAESLEIEVRAPSKAELPTKARLAALRALIDRLPHVDDPTRTHVALRHPLDELLAKRPDFIPVEELDRTIRKDEDGQFVGRFQFRLDPVALDRAQREVQPQWATPVGTIGVTPLGHFVIVDPDVGFLPGDRIVAIDGAAPTRENADALRYGAVLGIERDGARLELAAPEQRIEPTWIDDERHQAPTCGPCCHGDCGDKELYGPGGGLLRRKR
ncbi:MAG: hypothetical protein EP330_04975 [Deltaproteobacteria bacterium]|nr:MAG: hypothetical protein EP330_04975 [Deltaproteobacteria bacterium]